MKNPFWNHFSSYNRFKNEHSSFWHSSNLVYVFSLNCRFQLVVLESVRSFGLCPLVFLVFPQLDVHRCILLFACSPLVVLQIDGRRLLPSSRPTVHTQENGGGENDFLALSITKNDPLYLQTDRERVENVGKAKKLKKKKRAVYHLTVNTGAIK